MIYAWVRKTVKWRDEEAFRAQLEPRFAQRVELWDRSFEIPYHLFRHRVREIARESLARAEGVTVVEWDQIPDGALVVPIDDDDWLAPGIGPALEAEHLDGTLGWRWRASSIESPTFLGHRLYLWRRRVLPWLPEKWYCSSNNYALRKGPGAQDLLKNHMLASHRFKSWRREGAVRVIDCALSAINRNLASQTTLRFAQQRLGRAELLRKYRRYRRLYRQPLHEELRWCQPYVARMAELMDDLRLRDSAR